MRRIVPATLPLSQMFVLPVKAGYKFVGLRAIPRLVGTDAATGEEQWDLDVKLWLDVDESDKEIFRQMMWIQTGDYLPNEPYKHVGTITPGDYDLHLYELPARKISDEGIQMILDQRAEQIAACNRAQERAETNAKLCNIICGADPVYHKDSCPVHGRPTEPVGDVDQLMLERAWSGAQL